MQLRFEFALWTRAMIRELIAEQFGVRLSEVSVGRLLGKLGFSPQKPLYRAYQQNPEAVQRWLDDEYPAIRRQAEAEGALIYFGDEAARRSDFHRGTTWAPVGQTPVGQTPVGQTPVGQTPVGKTTGARFSLNLISAISARGLMRFMTVEGKLNAEKFVEFLGRLLHNSQQPIFLIVDGHPANRAALFKRFVESSQGRLRLFYLPSYSPEAESRRIGLAASQDPQPGSGSDHRPGRFEAASADRSTSVAEDARLGQIVFQRADRALRTGVTTSVYFRTD